MTRECQLIADLLQDCGYNHPDVIAYGAEENRLVALFMLPHAARRRPMTAFIRENSDGGFPRLDVHSGFVAVLTVD